jgi:hypothetical protein
LLRSTKWLKRKKTTQSENGKNSPPWEGIKGWGGDLERKQGQPNRKKAGTTEQIKAQTHNYKHKKNKGGS